MTPAAVLCLMLGGVVAAGFFSVFVGLVYFLDRTPANQAVFLIVLAVCGLATIWVLLRATRNDQG